MPSSPSIELTLLKAFEGALREGLLLDEAIGGILDAALLYFDAAAVSLLPAGGAPPMTRAGRTLVAAAAEQRLVQLLADVLAQARPSRLSDSGLTFVGIPAKVADQVRGAFGVAFVQTTSTRDPDEPVRLFARGLSHVLERDRTLSTLMKRREEAVALFELAAGALHSLNADEVMRLTVASLSRELEFDRVLAFRYDPERREIEQILSHGTAPPTQPAAAAMRRPLEQEEILARCLAAHGPAFDDEDTGGVGPARRRRLALPIHAGETIYGFLIVSRRGAFVLTPQEMRLAQELAKLAGGALERARLVDAEHLEADRAAFVARLHTALSGLTEVGAIVQRTVEEVGPKLDLDLCCARVMPAGELPGAAVAFARSGAGTVARGDEVPDALLGQLPIEGSHVLMADVTADPRGLSLVPVPSMAKNLPRPISLVAVPLAYRGVVVGALAGVMGGRPRAMGEATLRTLEALAVEISLALTAARLLQKERDSYRFLDRLREVGRTLSTTFDAPRIKQTLCEQSVQLLRADAAQFWDADQASKSAQISARFGTDVGGEMGRRIPLEKTTNPVVRAFLEKVPVLAKEDSAGSLFGGAVSVSQAAIAPLVYQDELVGALSLCGRRGSDPWAPEFLGRLALLADSGAVALHNARMMKIIEQQTERDSQTGLYNRASIIRRLESEIRRAERSGTSLAIAHVRLEGLNDAVQRLGPSFGDSILPKAASQLVRATRAVNVVGRDRGDRFWILVFDAKKEQAQRAAVAIQKNFDGASVDTRLPAAGIKLSLTLGIAAYPEDAFDSPSLLLRAEEALDHAVKTGPGSVVLYGALSEADSSLSL